MPMNRLANVMRSITMVGAMLGFGLFILGVLYNDGTLSLPGFAAFIVFSFLRYAVFGTKKEKEDIYSDD